MIIAVYGSPRVDGNTDLIADAFFESIPDSEVKKFYLRDLLLQYCTSCGECDKTGVCVFKDDIWSIYEQMEEAKAIVLVSPIYFASVTAQMKIFIDRSQAYWARKYILKKSWKCEYEKKGYFLSAGALDDEVYFRNAQMVIRTMMVSIDVHYKGDLFFAGIDKRGEINHRRGALDTANHLGQRFMYSL